MGRTAKGISTDAREGHGDESHIPSLSKGTFIDGGGTYADIDHKPTSVNRKSGGPSGTEAGGVSGGDAFGRS